MRSSRITQVASRGGRRATAIHAIRHIALHLRYGIRRVAQPLPDAVERAKALSLASEMRKNLWYATCVRSPPHPMGFTILPLTGTPNEGLQPHKAKYHGSGGWEGTDEAVNVQPCSPAGRDVQP